MEIKTIKEAVEKAYDELNVLEVGESLEIVSDYKGFLIECERIGDDGFRFVKYVENGALYDNVGEDEVTFENLKETLENYLEVTEDENGIFNFKIL